jgi:hypothetical protein
MGQAMVEFVLIGPVVFFIFFGIIQLFYMAFVFLAVQKTAITICQNAAASENPPQYNPDFDLIYTLAPLEKISPTLAETFLATNCQIESSNDEVRVTLHYPMIIWIPMFKQLFGQKFVPAALPQNADTALLNQVFSFAQSSVPAFQAVEKDIPYVHWFDIKASALDENSVPAAESENGPT